MSLNLYKYHTNPESIVGHEKFDDIILGIMKENLDFNEELGEFVYLETRYLGDIIRNFTNDDAVWVFDIMAGREVFPHGGYYDDYRIEQEDIGYIFDSYFEKNPEIKEKLEEYLEKKYGYDGGDIFDFVHGNNINEVIDAFDSATSVGALFGAESSLIRQFKSALEDMPHFRYDGDNVLSAKKYYISYTPKEALLFSKEIGIDRIITDTEYAEDDIKEIITERIHQDFSFEEPSYGWGEAFDETSAFDRLSDELYEILPKDSQL